MGKIENAQFIIPVTNQSYTDVRPTISGDSWEDIKQTAAEVAFGVGNTALGNVLSKDTNMVSAQTKTLTFKDVKVEFDEQNHIYSDGWISGSAFAEAFQKPFDKELIAGKVATKADMTADDVITLWNTKGDIATEFGSAIHHALEIRFRYDGVYNKLGGKEKIQSNNDYINDVVDACWNEVKLKESEMATTELFVADKDNKICGFIDLLVSDVDKKEVTIVDWKTNGDLDKKITWEKDSPYSNLEATILSAYKLQLSLYAYILKNAGYKVKECKIIHATERPTTYSFAPLSVEEGLKWIRK